MFNLDAEICVTLEFFNPSGSFKERPALRMLVDAFKSGKNKRAFYKNRANYWFYRNWYKWLKLMLTISG